MITFVDLTLDENKNILTDKFDFIIQEISILFDTDKGEVLGEDKFGTNFENFIWDLSVSNNEISSYITDAIYKNTISAICFDISVDTSVLYGTQNDIILVKIDIKDRETNEMVTLNYKID